MSPDVARAINSSPENAKLQLTIDDFWWGENGPKIQEKWDELVQE